MRVRIAGRVHTGHLRFVPTHGARLVDLGLVLLDPRQLERLGAEVVHATEAELAELRSLGAAAKSLAHHDTATETAPQRH
jgi:hypothetical protein